MKKKVLSLAIDTVLILIGTFLMGLAYNIFLAPNQISPSGFAGISTIITHLLQTYTGFYLSPSIFYIALNAILYIFAIKIMGKRFAITSAIGIIGYSVFMEVLKFEPFVNDDLLLCAIFGGILLGLGLGIVLRGRGSTGGSDMLGCIINKSFPSFSIGTAVVIVDAIVIGLSMFVYGVTFSLYALIAIYIMGKVSDIVVAGVNSVRAYYIVSEKSDEIAEEIIQKLPRGVTSFKTEGMFSHKEGKTLMCLVTNSQVALLKQIVSNIDINAFMFSTNVSEAMGRGFNDIKKPKKQLKITQKLEEIENEEQKNTLLGLTPATPETLLAKENKIKKKSKEKIKTTKIKKTKKEKDENK